VSQNFATKENEIPTELCYIQTNRVWFKGGLESSIRPTATLSKGLGSDQSGGFYSDLFSPHYELYSHYPGQSVDWNVSLWDISKAAQQHISDSAMHYGIESSEAAWYPQSVWNGGSDITYPPYELYLHYPGQSVDWNVSLLDLSKAAQQHVSESPMHHGIGPSEAAWYPQSVWNGGSEAPYESYSQYLGNSIWNVHSFNSGFTSLST
jgi:hypothetical protein